jgi:hypothetical protein
LYRMVRRAGTAVTRTRSPTCSTNKHTGHGTNAQTHKNENSQATKGPKAVRSEWQGAAHAFCLHAERTTSPGSWLRWRRHAVPTGRTQWKDPITPTGGEQNLRLNVAAAGGKPSTAGGRRNVHAAGA